MPTHIEQELGLAPVTHRFRRWLHNLFGRLGGGLSEPYSRTLDPLTVNYTAWREVRRNVREWPHYVEAPNSIEVLVSPEDWEDYWGIDTARKEEGVAAYVQTQAAKKGLWMSGDPQVIVQIDEGIEIGDLAVSCMFVEPREPEYVEETFAPTVTTRLQPLQTTLITQSTKPQPKQAAADGYAEEEVDYDEAPTVRFVDAEDAGEAYLVGEGGFRLVVHSGDCIGAVSPGESVPPEVNVRLDADAFPYVASKQCTIGVIDGRWQLCNHATRGTKLLTREGERYMLGMAEPFPINEGDTLYLGTDRPLVFQLPQETEGV